MPSPVSTAQTLERKVSFPRDFRRYHITMRRDFSVAQTCVFWDVEDFPIPDGEDPDSISEGIESALADEGYLGGVKIRAYGEKNKIWDEFIEALISVAPPGDKRGRVNRMMKDVLFWALDHPVEPSVPRTVMIIAKNISEDMEFLNVLDGLKDRDYNVIFTESDNVSPVKQNQFVSSRWFQGGNPIKLSGSSQSLVHKPAEETVCLARNLDTCVFWDVVDCPIPDDGGNPDSVFQNIKSALVNEGYSDKVNIRAYGEEKKICDGFILAKITVIPEGEENKVSRHATMMSDIIFWALDNQSDYPGQRNLMVISKNISRDKEFLKYLQILRWRHYKVLLAESGFSSIEKPRFVSSFWRWENLITGGKPIEQSGST